MGEGRQSASLPSSQPHRRLGDLFDPPLSRVPAENGEGFARAHARLDEALRRGCGFVAVCGEAGVGKTALVDFVVGEHPEYVAARTSPAESEPQAVVERLVTLAGARFALAGTSGKRDGLEAAAEAAANNGGALLLIVEDAHGAGTEWLERLRLAVAPSLESAADGPLVRVVLIGRPSLKKSLKRPEARGIASRIETRIDLERFSVEDVETMVWGRLGRVGIKHPERMISHRALRSIVHRGHGEPSVCVAMLRQTLSRAEPLDAGPAPSSQLRAAAPNALSRRAGLLGILSGVGVACLLFAVFYAGQAPQRPTIARAPLTNEPLAQAPAAQAPAARASAERLRLALGTPAPPTAPPRLLGQSRSAVPALGAGRGAPVSPVDLASSATSGGQALPAPSRTTASTSANAAAASANVVTAASFTESTRLAAAGSAEPAPPAAIGAAAAAESAEPAPPAAMVAAAAVAPAEPAPPAAIGAAAAVAPAEPAPPAAIGAAPAAAPAEPAPVATSPPATPAPAVKAAGRMAVQVGAFAKRERAEALLAALPPEFAGAVVRRMVSKGAPVFRVRFVGLAGLAAARSLQERLRQSGYDSFAVRE